MMVKISLNTVTRECVADSTFLGFEGENQANVLDFSFSDKFVDGTAVLNIKRGKDTGFVSVDKVGSGYQLPVKSSLLSQVGEVTFQFVITTVDGAIMKFDPFVMTVEDAIDTDVPLPEEYPSWVEMANTKLAEIDVAIEQANKISNQILVDKANGVFDGRDGLDGANGVSPVVKTEQTSIGTKITITDATGTHVAELLNGQRGETGATGERGPRGEAGPEGPQGPAGKDGTLTFEELTEEQKATLKGDRGPTGPQGIQGPQGPQGIQGPVGATGPQGPAGPQGPKGDTGDAGATGPAGANGLTPYIGNNGNWWIGDTDTGTPASGSGSGGTGGDSTPVGNIISFMGTIAPSGYLICDGTEKNIADYPRLASHFETQFGTKNHFGGDGTTTFALPDLRNEFLRGYGDKTNEVGIHQDATNHLNFRIGGSEEIWIDAHKETLVTECDSYSDIDVVSNARIYNKPDTIGSDHDDNYGGEPTYYTSRPTNVAVLYCIKY